MKIKLVFFLAIFFYSITAFTQIPDSLATEKGDTLETIISDTSIIYVIKVAPVTIREKFEVVRPKEKKKYYLSMNFSLMQFSEKRKAVSGYEDYVTAINSTLSNSPGYSLGMSIWKCQKRIYTGIGINFIRLNQTFNHTSQDGYVFSADNHYNYMNVGLQLGYWFRKEKKVSILAYGSAYADYMLSYSRYTLSTTDPSFVRNLRSEISYRRYLMDLSVNIKFLVNMKTILLEVEPYFAVTPISATNSNSPYSLTRSYLGLRLGVSHKLF